MKFKIQSSKIKIAIQKLKFLKIFYFLLVLLIFTFCLLTLPVYAQTPSPVDIGKIFGFGDIKSLGEATTRLVNPAFSIAAVMVVLYLLFGAFKYLTSGGEKEAVSDASKMMTHAFIGFLILMFAFLALKYLLFAIFGIQGFEIITSQ